jgi:hypothetical protein
MCRAIGTCQFTGGTAAYELMEHVRGVLAENADTPIAGGEPERLYFDDKHCRSLRSGYDDANRSLSCARPTASIGDRHVRSNSQT